MVVLSPKSQQKTQPKKRVEKGQDLSIYKADPIAFATEILGIDRLTNEQQEILISIRDNRTTNVQAAHSVGKSFVCALAVLYWVFAVEGTCFTTAPSLQQVKDILWREVRKIYDRNRAKLGGYRGELFVKKHESAVAIGYTSRSNDSNSFQGRHAERLLIVQDEADGISKTIDEAMESCLTGSLNRAVRIGNPLTKHSVFAVNCTLSSLKIPVWAHPNLKGCYGENKRLLPEVAEKVLAPNINRDLYLTNPSGLKIEDPIVFDVPEPIAGAVSVRWIEKVRLKYGEDSPYWRSRVEALFPDDSSDGLIPHSWLEAARKRYDDNPEYWDESVKNSPWVLGVDVGDGGDRHAISIWKGTVLYDLKTYQPKGDREDTLRLAQDIIPPLVRRLGGDVRIAVDRLGVGAGTLAHLIRAGYSCKACTFGAAAENKEEYKNRKTELYWLFREMLRLETMAIAPLTGESDIFAELTAPSYSLDSKTVAIESKHKSKERLGRSPDCADAIVTALEWKVETSFSMNPVAAS